MLVLLYILGCAPVNPTHQTAPDAPPPRVAVSMSAHVNPDGGVLLGVRYLIPEGWHIYWLNPGDTGLPTSATLTLPEPWTSEGPLYTAPERFMSPGDIVSYGYAGEARLLFRAQAPAGWTEARAQVESRWLLCREICVPDSATLSAPFTPKSEDTALVQALAQTPRPFSSLVGAVARQTETALVYEIPGAKALELFPSAELALALDREERGQTPDGASLTLHLRGPAPADPGVLAVTTGAKARLIVQLPPTSSPASEISP